jgi:hypothetical protein
MDFAIAIFFYDGVLAYGQKAGRAIVLSIGRVNILVIELQASAGGGFGVAARATNKD